MKVVIIGSGLIGLTSAFFLKRSGHDVTVIDRQEGPARETSFANGSLLTPSMADPWNAPGSAWVLLSSLGRSDPALQLRWRALPALIGWGIRFLRNSRAEAFHRNTLSNLHLASYSLRVLSLLRQETGIDYERTARGTLRIFHDVPALRRAGGAAAAISSGHFKFQQLTAAEVVDLEPGLKPISKGLSGGLYNAVDETGDAYRFCVALTDVCRCRGVEFQFGTSVSSLEVRRGEITGVITSKGRVTAAQYLVAAGSYCTPLLRAVGIRFPVQPGKGYSVTFAGGGDLPELSIPVVDDHWHAAVVPIGGGIRVAGTAEFAGYDLTVNPGRVRNLERLARTILPKAELKHGKPWCGLRPMSADGVPLIGLTRIRNLWVSAGHGHLGWTMAAGSGQFLADLVSNRAPALEPEPYDPKRFPIGMS
jgi:D-amino-acid dehydrogenase